MTFYQQSLFDLNMDKPTWMAKRVLCKKTVTRVMFGRTKPSTLFVAGEEYEAWATRLPSGHWGLLGVRKGKGNFSVFIWEEDAPPYRFEEYFEIVEWYENEEDVWKWRSTSDEQPQEP